MMMQIIIETAANLNVSCDFLQSIGRWNFNPNDPNGKMSQLVSATIDNGKVLIEGAEPNYAAILKIQEIANSRNEALIAPKEKW